MTDRRFFAIFMVEESYDDFKRRSLSDLRNTTLLC
jgi:hypothetical protein